MWIKGLYVMQNAYKAVKKEFKQPIVIVGSIYELYRSKPGSVLNNTRDLSML